MRVRGSHFPVLTCSVEWTLEPEAHWDSDGNQFSGNWGISDNCTQCFEIEVWTSRNSAIFVFQTSLECSEVFYPQGPGNPGDTMSYRIIVKNANGDILLSMDSNEATQPP